MRLQLRVVLAALLGLAACAERPKLVMINPRTGVMVGCRMPDPLAGSGEFLISRACLSACAAHGFRAVPGAPATGAGDETPAECLN